MEGWAVWWRGVQGAFAQAELEGGRTSSPSQQARGMGSWGQGSVGGTCE